MTRLYSQTTTSATTTTPATLPDARKLANKERRKAGRERHEERKDHQKAVESDRKWERLERDGQRQGERRDDGTRAFAGRNIYNHRVAGTLHVRATDIIGAAEDGDHDTDEESTLAEELVVPQATSGAMLLAMARPAKSRRRRCPPSVMTDGEAFEVVEVDGRLVALDEDGWEILPDENAEASLLYSDIVRGIER